MAGKITPDACESMRRWAEEGIKQVDIVDRLEEQGVSVTQTTVSIHVNGKCSHDHAKERGLSGPSIEKEPSVREADEEPQPVFRDWRNRDDEKEEAEAPTETADGPRGNGGPPGDDGDGLQRWRLSEGPPEPDPAPGGVADGEDDPEPEEAEDDGPPERMPLGYDDDVDVFKIVSSGRRRTAIRVLVDAGDSITTGGLADRVTATEYGKTVDNITSDERKRVYVGLYQCHLGKMDKAGLGEFDRNRGVFYPNHEVVAEIAEWMNEAPNGIAPDDENTSDGTGAGPGPVARVATAVRGLIPV